MHILTLLEKGHSINCGHLYVPNALIDIKKICSCFNTPEIKSMIFFSNIFRYSPTLSVKKIPKNFFSLFNNLNFAFIE